MYCHSYILFKFYTSNTITQKRSLHFLTTDKKALMLHYRNQNSHQIKRHTQKRDFLKEVHKIRKKKNKNKIDFLRENRYFISYFLIAICPPQFKARSRLQCISVFLLLSHDLPLLYISRTNILNVGGGATHGVEAV